MSKGISLAKNIKAIKMLEKFVRQGWSDPKIRDAFKQEFDYEWSIQTIRRNRKKLGLVKNKAGDINVEFDRRPVLSVPPPGLKDVEKASWFREQFKKSHLYGELKEQFHINEVIIYLEEYGNVCCQFEDIVTSEFFQIDDYLKHRILISKQLKLMKSLELEIDQISEWITAHPFTMEELDLDKEIRAELSKARIEKHRVLDSLHHSMKATNDRYDKLVAERQKIMSNLAATRKDRQDELRGGKATFFELVIKLQSSSKEREKQGRYAKLTKLAAKDIAKRFRQPVQFPDNTMQPIILDSETSFEDNDSE